MEKTIWKFDLEITKFQKIEMPLGAEILSVQAQHENPRIWALVDPNQEKEVRYFEVLGSGHAITYGMGTSRNYLNTFQLQSGMLIFHVFEYTGI